MAQARAAVAAAQAAVERAEEELDQRHDPVAHRRHGPLAPDRTRQPGVVHPEPRRERHARDGARRHQPGLRARATSTRPTSARSGSASRRASRWRRSATSSSRARSRRSRRWAPTRTTSSRFEVKVSIDNSAGELLANMTANAEIILEEHKQHARHPRGGHRLRRASGTRRSTSYLPGAKTGRERRPDQGRRQQRHAHAGARAA